MIRGEVNGIIMSDKQQLFEGQTLEEMIFKMMQQGAMIEASSPIIYTERKDGINPLYDIRSDRFDLALEATSKIEQALKAKRVQNYQPDAQNTADNGNGNTYTPTEGNIA